MRLRFVADLRDRGGGYELRGWLDREAAEIVRSALSPLAAPRPTTDVEVDLRDAAQRDADALVDLAQRALGGGELPTEGGERPQVVVTVSLAVCRAGLAPRRWLWAARSTPTSHGASPATPRSSRWCWVRAVSHWTLDAPATRCQRRSGARCQRRSGDIDVKVAERQSVTMIFESKEFDNNPQQACEVGKQVAAAVVMNLPLNS